MTIGQHIVQNFVVMVADALPGENQHTIAIEIQAQYPVYRIDKGYYGISIPAVQMNQCRKSKSRCS